MDYQLVWSTLLGAGAWLVAKHWEIGERRRLRYIEFVTLIPALFENGSEDGREALLKELRRFWVDGSRATVLAAERAFDAIERRVEGDPETLLKTLIVQMRADVRFPFGVFRKDLRIDDIKFRTASPSSSK